MFHHIADTGETRSPLTRMPVAVNCVLPWLIDGLTAIDLSRLEFKPQANIPAAIRSRTIQRTRGRTLIIRASNEMPSDTRSQMRSCRGCHELILCPAGRSRARENHLGWLSGARARGLHRERQ